ncbi:MAG: lipoyl(octanoyl) transferase LipB [Pseudomonadota bacterium]
MARPNRRHIARPKNLFRNDRHIEWQVDHEITAYDDAVRVMEDRAEAIASGEVRELIWLVEHPPIYTAGTSSKPDDLMEPDRFPVFQTGRGGQYTYHGPGQRVVYTMLNLNDRGRDVRAFVAGLEDWIIATLDRFNVHGERREDRVGVWVQRPEKASPHVGMVAEDKIAAIGIRLRKWVSFHGLSINVEPDLDHFSGIVPCGVETHGMTSLVDLGLPVTMDDVDIALRTEAEALFGPLTSPS